MVSVTEYKNIRIDKNKVQPLHTCRIGSGVQWVGYDVPILNEPAPIVMRLKQKNRSIFKMRFVNFCIYF